MSAEEKEFALEFAGETVQECALETAQETVQAFEHAEEVFEEVSEEALTAPLHHPHCWLRLQAPGAERAQMEAVESQSTHLPPNRLAPCALEVPEASQWLW